MSTRKVISHVRHRREAAGLSQAALARRAGVSRQAILAAESVRHIPSTSLALELARGLGCAVEDLFELAPPGSLEVVVAAAECPPLAAAGPPTRVTLARVDGRWVAHRLADASLIAADGILTHGELDEPEGIVTPLADLSQLADHVLVAGCAPVLALLAQRASRRYAGVRVTWCPANNARALDLLAAGLVHVAGIHLPEARTGGDSLAAVRDRFADRRMVVVNLTSWRQGLVTARGNPRAPRGAADLLQPGLRFARREPGAGANTLLARVLEAAGASENSRALGPSAASHAEVATLVRCEAADVGIGIESAALSAGLDFVPLSEERFDLVLPADRATSPPVSRVLDLLADAGFHAEVDRLPGYDSRWRGQVTTLEPRSRP